MSADKRKTFLIVFSGLAAILVAATILYSPAFRSEDATGAIGAVQKHRQPQIARKDVILGTEKQQQRQKVLYKDYLKDAAVLQNLSADFKVPAKRIDARTRIEEQKRQVGIQFYEDIESAGLGLKQLAENKAAALSEADIEAFAAKARSHSVENEVLTELSAKLRHMVDSVEAAAVDMKQIDNVRAAVEQKNLEAAKDSLQSAERSLEMMLDNRADYAAAMAQEMNTLDQIETRLADEDAAGLGAKLNRAAADLEHQAAENMKENLRYEQKAIDSLGKMAESLSRFNNQAFNKSVDSFKAEIENEFAIDVQSQIQAIQLYSDNADALGVHLSDEIVAEVNAISAVAENTAYASMLAHAGTLAAQSQALMNHALESKKK